MPKPTICFSILNAVATLSDLHNLSDAGAGKGLMGYTPANNSEMIALGRDITSLPGVTPQPLLSNGGVTPALLTHALLQLFRQAGHKVVMRIYNLNLPVQPSIDTDESKLDSVELWSCSKQGIQQLVNQTLLPNLQQEDQDGWISILGECGVGGTTYSNLWLSLLLKKNLAGAGSTIDPEKLRQKQALVERLKQRYLSNHTSLSTHSLFASECTHDDFQIAVVYLLQGLAKQHRKNPLMLAGGLMYIAPWMMLNYQYPGLAEKLKNKAVQTTTRWVYQDVWTQFDHDALPGCDIEAVLSETDFQKSRHKCLQLYEQGIVVEGCGLGGCLVLAEQQGFIERDILAAMDGYVDNHIASFNRDKELSPHFT